MGRFLAVVILIGILITAAATWTAWLLNQRTEHRLLRVQTRQAAAVIASTIPGISEPLTTALHIEAATAGNRAQFARFMTTYTKSGKSPQLFASASLWQHDHSSWRPVVVVGTPPVLSQQSAATGVLIRRAQHTTSFAVATVAMNGQKRIGYAVTSSASPTLAVLAERIIPTNRQVPVERNSAFSELNYATYLGSMDAPNDPATTDVPISDLPLTGDTARASIPFGDTKLILVTSPRGELSGPLAHDLPWFIAIVGLLLTVGAVVGATVLLKHRRDAESDARTIADLYDDLDALYSQQRTIAETLQHALLPAFNPDIPNLEIASRYIAGAEGVDVGGDWYSVMPVDARHFAFAVGDVSGRGVSAATIMARLRYTIRAYLVEGHPPDVVLEKCSQQIDFSVDGHFATVIVGIGDVDTRQITLANAGHFSPLIISEASCQYATTAVGVPLGVASMTYETTTTVMPSGSTLLAFTDGLVERRGESIDVGLERLAAAAGTESSLEDLLDHLVSELTNNGSEDDIAILALRWRADT
jgi:hypothetical protein